MRRQVSELSLIMNFFYDFYKLQNGVEIDSEKAELVDSILEEVKEN